MNTLKSSFQNILYYPSALIGCLVVFLLVFTAIYAMIKIPYTEAINLWRGGEDIWYQNPKFAAPAWINLFSSRKYSESFAVSTADGTIEKVVVPGAENTATFTMNYAFDFEYDFYPQDLILYITSEYNEKQPFISVEWLTPDGRTIRVANFAVGQEFTYRFSQDDKLKTKLRSDDVIPFLFSLPDDTIPARGKYQLLVTGTTFEAGSDINLELVLHGQVYGLAGTDHARRDPLVPLLWGGPVALAFWFIASLG